ncbi:MAG: polyphosphate kinase 2 family protein [Planctomycetota bacterium]|nr:polyphosphate kinase 2 family protein [Planctomycetota bacterium]
MAESLTTRLRIRPRQRVKLARHDPDFTGAFQGKAEVKSATKKNVERLFDLQYKMYAENKHSLLVVLQAMDTAGKDGLIRHVMTGMNPQGCRVVPFKKPSEKEFDHEYLWRIHQAVPPKGEVGIFNRSHYEDVLVVRVHDLVPKSVWSKRFEQINRFEHYLAENGVTIVKFFLHISKDEQKKRLEARLKDPLKRWKFSVGDLAERKHWNEYMLAYEEVLSKCSTPWAPWYVIPANAKWFRNYAVSQILVETLNRLRMSWPKVTFDPKKIKVV